MSKDNYGLEWTSSWFSAKLQPFSQVIKNCSILKIEILRDHFLRSRVEYDSNRDVAHMVRIILKLN